MKLNGFSLIISPPGWMAGMKGWIKGWINE